MHVMICIVYLLCRIFLEQMHDSKLAEEYCDSVYTESQRQHPNGLSQLPMSLQLHLQSRTASRDVTAASTEGNRIYLMLAQVTKVTRLC